MNKELIELAIKNNTISKDNYTKYAIKRGLRNSDGSGVLVGLTEIGSVLGYKVVDGDVKPVHGKLYYRGIEINELVKGFQADGRYGYEEIAFLLIFGKLPTEKELKRFCEKLADFRELPANFKEDMILKFKGKDLMNMLARSVLILYALDDNPDDISIENVLNQSMALLAKLPVLAVYSYQAIRHEYYSDALVLRYPKPELGAAENFLYLLKGDRYTPFEAEILDLMLVLHAEHGGGNNSSFTTRAVSSSGTDTYSVISAAIGSLKGPLHGGASKKAREMMLDIEKNVKEWSDEEDIKTYLTKIIKKETFDKSGKLFGFGHSVYTLSDPRRVVIKEKARELAKRKGREKEFNLYEKVEELGPEIVYSLKGKRKTISANVDFYSGFIYDCLGIPSEFYTALFAIARTAGWSAHRIEEILSSRRIMRPSYKALSSSKEYIPLEKRD